MRHLCHFLQAYDKYLVLPAGSSVQREGFQTEHNRGYDDAVRGGSDLDGEDLGDVDPDSAESDVDRDDTLDD